MSNRSPDPRPEAVALIAHDQRKEELAGFCSRNAATLARFRLIGTGMTASVLRERTGLEVEGMKSGPYGGDLQIGAQVAEGQVIAVIFFRDPHTAQPHEPDVRALMRICDVHGVPLATNPGTAEAILSWLERRAGEQAG